MIQCNLEDEIHRWLSRDPDTYTRDEITRLLRQGATEELESRFCGRLAFGTAGLRAKVGAGPMRLNRLVIRETTVAVGTLLIREFGKATKSCVVVGFDARLDSQLFAHDAACVLAGMGIRVSLFYDASPTPLVAYAVKTMNASAGIVITASHNPPEYNGYKLYWHDGMQILSPLDRTIESEISRSKGSVIPWLDLDSALSQGLILMVESTIKVDYIESIRALLDAVCPAEKSKATFPIAYTALHGVGAESALQMLEKFDFTEIYSVANQHVPDGNFPTIYFPNPEEPGAMENVLCLAKAQDCSIAVANDPDADRLAVAARDNRGEYRVLTGDQVGVLLGHYLLQQSHAFRPILCTTIVSSGMLRLVAEDYDALFVETLTGFKWLCHKGMELQDDQNRFLFAYEEALGYAIGDVVCDKDGLSALAAFSRMVAYLAVKGKTVFDQLETLYRRYGLHMTRQQVFPFEAGMVLDIERLSKSIPDSIKGFRVLSIDNLRSGHRYYVDGTKVPLNINPSDVLICRFESNSKIVVRPSETEPKLKCYFELVSKIGDGESLAKAEERTEESLKSLQKAWERLLLKAVS